MRAKVRIDERHTLKLLERKRVAIKVPEGATVIEIELTPPPRDRNYVAEIFDVFFNERPAR